MAHKRHVINKLSAAFCKTAPPGKHIDGGTLCLYVRPSGSKSWVQSLVIRGKRREMGLGGFPLVSLAEARQIAFDNRKVARAGGDPRTAKAKPVPTFREAMEAVIKIQSGGWRGGSKSALHWRASLKSYASPILDKPVSEISTADVLALLVPIWQKKRETAGRVRQRIGAVMRWAIAQGHRNNNPAGEAIGSVLPKNRVQKVHMRALPYAEVADAIRTVQDSNSRVFTKLLFEFIVLTAARSGEARGAKWKEFDLDNALWSVPGERMKGGRVHRVPLSGRVLEVLAEAKAQADKLGIDCDLVFPSGSGEVMTDGALSKMLRRLGVQGVPHGCRSSFRDFASERTNTPVAVMEASLAHANKNQVEAAYARSDLFERRQKLMNQWAQYLNSEQGKVIRLHG